MTSPIPLRLNSGESISLVVEKSRSFALYHNEKWDSHRLFALIEECPELQSNANALAEVVYHLVLRNSYKPISNVPEFKRWYKAQVEKESSSGSLADDQIKVTACGVCDVTGMHDPAIIEQCLEFYVESLTHVPNVVKVPFKGPSVRCLSMLVKHPFVEEEEEEEPLTLDD